MFKSLGKFGLVSLVGLFSMLAVVSLNAKTLKVIDAYHHIKNNRSCLKDLVKIVKFGSYTNLTIDKCDINKGKVNFIVDVKLSKPFSKKNTKQFLKIVDAFGLEIAVSRKELLSKKICKLSLMPKGAECSSKLTGAPISATVYEGVNSLKLYFTDK